MKRTMIGFVCIIPLLMPAKMMAAGQRPITLEDFYKLKRVSDPQISPDGKWVAYVVGEVDMEANRIPSSIWLAATDSKSEPRRLTNAAGKKDRHPRWSPDSKRILFESNRSGDSQLWMIDVNGGESRQVTTISTGANTGIWSPDGKHIAFVSAVWPEYSHKDYFTSNELSKKRKEDLEKNPVKAKVLTKLFYRHWDEWVEDKRQHLFVLRADWALNATDGFVAPKDVTPGDRDAYPTSDTFSVGDDFTFSPDSKYLVYTAPPERNEAWSTNYDIWRVPITGGKAENLTKDNPAADGAPRFSPNGRKLAFRAQRRPGFEADKWELWLVDCQPNGEFLAKPKSVTHDNAFSVSEFAWVKYQENGPFADKADWFMTIHDESGRTVLHTMPRSGTANLWGAIGQANGYYSSLSISKDGSKIAYLHASMHKPLGLRIEKTIIDGNGFSRDMSHNAELVAELQLPLAESVTVKGAGGTPMHMWILKPPGFDPKKKWPLVYLVHGGPQGAWEDGWHWRWNPQIWAAQGYVIAMPNPRGSTGFGQKYVDEISGDWGGKCYDDLMAGVEYLEKQPWIDKDRMAAAGASFGGYMMNWFQGHTTKFKTLITHCGVYNFDSMYATTDELWFDEWEHGGPPWGKDRHSYDKFSPHKYAKNFKTPMLIIHNDGDFRVPVSQGYELFTTLQRLGVPSKMINFPDETHFVAKPKNSEYWHKEIFAWLKKYTPPGGR